ncbi:MAG: acetyl-CoA hydrolase/transferase family protein [Ilumatobacter sp.]
MAQTVTPEEAAAIVRPDDEISVPLGPGVPGMFLHALDARDDFTDLRINGALLPDLYGVFVKPGVSYRSGFFGPAERFLLASGADVEFVPSDFRGFGPMLSSLATRVVATMATPPDDDGWMSLSLHAGAHVHELRAAARDPERLCLVETSPHFPRTRGIDAHHVHALHIDEVDVVVEAHATPLHLAGAPAGAVAHAIAEFVVPLIPDEATLQTGIGGIPNAVAARLADADGGGYGIHSEMFTTGLMRLCEAGKVTNANKGLFDGVSVTTFAAGEPELYEWLHENDDVRFLPVDLVNAPEQISRNRKMVSINGAMAIDLSGQVVADTIAGSQFSGIGGHEDFVAGASLIGTDRSLICLPSTSDVHGVSVSRIVSKLPVGSIVTTPRHQVDTVVTELGGAELRGRTVRERARALAAIGHPDVRAELEAVAEEWPS